MAPRTPVERSLAGIWAEVLGLERVGVCDNFFELGGQSLLAAELFARLEHTHGVRLALASLFPDATIERQAQLVEGGKHSTARSIVPIQPGGRRPPFICVHAIDGDVLRFEPLARMLGSDQPFYGLRAQGLDADSDLAPIDDIETMALHYVDDLLHAGFGAPFYLGGYSSGATIAFEIARQLSLRGHAIALLALFDGDAPGWRHGRARRIWRGLQNLPADLLAYVTGGLRPGQRAEFLRSKARRVPGWVSRYVARRPIDWESLGAVAGFSERHLAVAQAQYEALRRYTPRLYSGRAVVFRARVRQLASSHHPYLGWDALARGGVDVFAVGGGHTQLLREPDVRELADVLRRCIDEQQTRSSGPSSSRPAGLADPNRASATDSFVPFEEEEVEQSVAARFERQVELHPHRLALKSETHEFTYAELNRLANRIGHAILAHSADLGDQVGFLFNEPTLAIAASLGALKVGRVYVSLDPTYPRARQEFILSDAEVGIILTDPELVEQAREIAGGRIVVALDPGALDQSWPAENPALPIPPDAFTYIVYTSGSTGKPKGVVENQRNVLHFTLNNTNAWRLCPNDRISLLVPYWFSASATPTFGALLNGAALLPMNVRQHGLAGLADWLVRENITIFHCSASLFRHFARALPEGRVIPNVRLIHQGSEPLFRSDVELYKQHFADHCVSANNLGASEMKNFSTFSIDKHTLLTERVVPVGYPVPGVELLLVDDNDRPVEAGAIGQIVVRSRFIAPGYWRRPELTERAFRPDPSGGDARLYFTGDLARRDSTGCLHHIGRRDSQVKIRGYRVELGDVTAALLELHEVAEALVVADQAYEDRTRLVAYVVPTTGHELTMIDLRRALQDRLPSYMLPSAYITLAALPRNANGKIDSAALPQPDRARPGAAAE